MPEYSLGLIGCGNLGTALLNGFISQGALSPSEIAVTDVNASRLEFIRAQFGVTALSSRELVKASSIIVIAVKPKDFRTLCAEIRPHIPGSATIVSVAAGIPISSISELLGSSRIVRMMPNLPISYGSGIIAFCPGKGVSEEAIVNLARIFGKLGCFIEISERIMPFITAISGSGPGFLFFIAEVFFGMLLERGFSETDSLKIVAFLFTGAGAMLKSEGVAPEVLRQRVCSPGGTTVAGLDVFNRRDLAGILGEAVKAAEKRAEELGGKV